jgi:hypothetical protein
MQELVQTPSDCKFELKVLGIILHATIFGRASLRGETSITLQLFSSHNATLAMLCFINCQN